MDSYKFSKYELDNITKQIHDIIDKGDNQDIIVICYIKTPLETLKMVYSKAYHFKSECYHTKISDHCYIYSLSQIFEALSIISTNISYTSLDDGKTCSEELYKNMVDMFPTIKNKMKRNQSYEYKIEENPEYATYKVYPNHTWSIPILVNTSLEDYSYRINANEMYRAIVNDIIKETQKLSIFFNYKNSVMSVNEISNVSLRFSELNQYDGIYSSKDLDDIFNAEKEKMSNILLNVIPDNPENYELTINLKDVINILGTQSQNISDIFKKSKIKHIGNK
jgi:hypothetical protein